MEVINTIGRRKSAPQTNVQYNIEDPFNTLDIAGTYDVKVNVRGGGFKGQAEAIRMAISRALCKVSEDYRTPLKAKKYLSRDARVVERKKFGKPKARKSFQYE